MPSCSRFRAASLILACAVFLFGCGSDGPAAESDWTIQDGALTLERDLLVSEGESFYFGTILDVAPSTDGRIYVADADAGHVKVLSPDGTLLDSLGRQGEGPGEFQRLNQLATARGDSLYVLDSRRRRVSVFAPSGDFARDLTVDPGQGFPQTILVPEGRSGLYLQHFTLPLSSDATRGSYVVRRLRADGSVADTVVTKQRAPSHKMQRGDTKMFLPIPFKPSLHAALGPTDRVHIARGDSLSVVSYGSDGQRREVSIPFQPVPVTDADEERVLKNYSDKRPMPRDKIPATKPAFESFLMDDEGRYWFGRPTANPDSTNWWVADPDEKRVATTRLPDDVGLRAVQNDLAYGVTSTEAGAPALVRYRVRVAQ